MTITAIEKINAPRERVWEIVTDFDNLAENISAITSATVLERPDSGIVGLKWQETRVMFGKEASETMWITAVQDGQWYETTAHNCGSIYSTRIELQESDGVTQLSTSFSAVPQTLLAKLFSGLGFLFNGAMKKAFQQDLQDVKALAEKD